MDPTSITPGPDQQYILVFTFANPLTRVDGVSVAAPITFEYADIGADPHQYIVHLADVPDGQYLSVTLDGAGDEAGGFSDNVQSVVAGILVGDTTGDGGVSGADITQTKAQVGNPANANNFRQDVTVDGSISGADVTVVKRNAGNGLQMPGPTPPRRALTKKNK